MLTAAQRHKENIAPLREILQTQYIVKNNTTKLLLYPNGTGFAYY